MENFTVARRKWESAKIISFSSKHNSGYKWEKQLQNFIEFYV
jgi:hypothetical protein